MSLDIKTQEASTEANIVTEPAKSKIYQKVEQVIAKLGTESWDQAGQNSDTLIWDLYPSATDTHRVEVDGQTHRISFYQDIQMRQSWQATVTRYRAKIPVSFLILPNGGAGGAEDIWVYDQKIRESGKRILQNRLASMKNDRLDAHRALFVKIIDELLEEKK